MMKTDRPCNGQTRLTRAAFSLIEVIVAIAIIGLVIGTFYTALTHGFTVLRMEYEDRRATQILVQKAETIRMYNWDQVNSNGFIPPTFTVAYDPQSAKSGVTYTGTITIADAPLGTPYCGGELKQVSVRLNWTTGQLARQRELKTFVARYGLQTYVE
jgi:prepilin-type N-terminal cleavage/methylation domain-containing protein